MQTVTATQAYAEKERANSGRFKGEFVSIIASMITYSLPSRPGIRNDRVSQVFGGSPTTVGDSLDTVNLYPSSLPFSHDLVDRKRGGSGIFKNLRRVLRRKNRFRKNMSASKP